MAESPPPSKFYMRFAVSRFGDQFLLDPADRHGQEEIHYVQFIDLDEITRYESTDWDINEELKLQLRYTRGQMPSVTGNRQMVDLFAVEEKEYLPNAGFKNENCLIRTLARAVGRFCRTRRFDNRFDRFESQPAINVRKACARMPQSSYPPALDAAANYST